MQLKNVDIYVFKIDDNETFDALGEIIEYTSLIWPDKFNGYATFELTAPITPENKTLIKKGNIIWCGGNNACMIEIIQSDKNDEGQKTYKVKGRTLEMLLTTRIIWGTYSCINKYSSTAMYEIVDKHCINPSDSLRKIPFLECAVDEKLGKVISFQKTGGEVYDQLVKISSDSDLGFDVLFRPRERKLIFKVTEGVDKTIVPTSGNASNLVVFSTELEDILSSSYYTNNQDAKTLAYVAGEEAGEERKHIISGNNASKGLARRELYVDARDLQSVVQDEIGSWEALTPDDYNDMLNSRGLEKLAEHSETETFEAKMRMIGDIQYRYGIDYNKGDKVIIQDTDLDVQVIAMVTEVSENYDDEYELIITFGYSYPTIIEKVKRQIS